MAFDRFGFEFCRRGTEIVGPASFHLQRLIIGHTDDFLALDIEPAPHGTQWQVLALDHDPPMIVVLANSLETHMKDIVRMLRHK